MAKRISKEESNGPLVKKRRPRLQLSDLPMDILHSIVSRLPIRQAVRTSILSKHWRHIWCSRPNLRFSFRSLIYKKGYDAIVRRSISEYIFIQRVNAVLKQHSGLGVEKMDVHFFPLDSEHTEHIDRWVQFAIASKTKQLILDLVAQRPFKNKAREPYSFPFQLFNATNASHLQSLKLGSVSLTQPANIKVLLNLQKLELADVNITDDELKVMLLNCNVLEFLGVSCCGMLSSLQIPRHLNHLKHLHVSDYPLLQGIEFNFSLITLEYEGSLIPLEPPCTLRNASIKASDMWSALAYIFTNLHRTLPRVETLTLRCEELERATLPNKPLKFLYLRHLRLELNFVSLGENTDVLDLACLLEAAPLMEKLEVHMWVDCDLERYHRRHGELRSLPSHPHSHLKLVSVTGFYGQKDQLELALYILRNASVIEAMKIDPRPMVAAEYLRVNDDDGPCLVAGYQVAKKYLCRIDHRGVVDVLKVRWRDIDNVSIYSMIAPGPSLCPDVE